jgi:hypothetical protein
MTRHDRFPSICIPSPRPVPTCSGRLVPVCSPAALRLFLALVARLLTASRVACAYPRRGAWPRRGLGGSASTIGNASPTR